MARVEVGFFSFTQVPAGAHRAYNEWHQLDHLPEQMAIPGVARGERWVATPGCVAARLADDGSLGAAQYLTLYLMGEPVGETLAEFRALAGRLRAAGRFFEERRALMFGAWRVEAIAAPSRVLVRAEVVPWRPATGIYVVVEPGIEAAGGLAELAPLVEQPGVAGGWTFLPDPGLRHESWQMRPCRITVLWLDADPVVAAAAVEPVLRRRWDAARVEPVLAGPMARVEPGRWDWFD